MRKKLENFSLKIGNIAIDKVSRNKRPFIEVVMQDNPDIRGIFKFDDCQFVGGNLPINEIPQILDKVKRNRKFLEV